MDRWNQFREKRSIIVDKFIKAKKTQRAMRQVYHILLLRKILFHLKEVFEEEVFKHRKQNAAVYMCFVMNLKWRRHMRRR